MISVSASLLVFVGALISFVASVGVLRLPDFFMRMHAATKAGVGGAGFVMLGVGLSEGSLEVWCKVLFVIFFLLLTTPIAGHLLGRAGYVAGVPLWRGTVRDELGSALQRGSFERGEFDEASRKRARKQGDV